jgi:hypothetical protein
MNRRAGDAMRVTAVEAGAPELVWLPTATLAFSADR